jgi:hypothetical protein
VIDPVHLQRRYLNGPGSYELVTSRPSGFRKPAVLLYQFNVCAACYSFAEVGSIRNMFHPTWGSNVVA